MSLDGTLRVESNSVTLESTAVVVAPDYSNRMDAGDARILAIDLEPESDEYASLIPSLLSDDDSQQLCAFDPAPDDLESLRSLCDVNNDLRFAWAICVSASGLGICSTPLNAIDACVDLVIAIIQAEPSATRSVDRLATAVHISPSRLRHLFRENVGVPIWRFIVWSRIRQVVQLGINGATLTEAALSAEFSEAAHI